MGGAEWRLVVEKELFGVEERPVDIDEGCPDLVGFFEVTFEGLFLLLCRRPGEGSQVEFGHNFLRRLIGLPEGVHEGTGDEFGLDGISREQVQGLGEGGVDLLTGADVVAFGSSEGGEEVVGSTGVGDLNSAEPDGQSEMGHGSCCGLGDGVEEDFRAQPADGGLCEIAGV